jgi:hypothetical protein
VHMLAASKFESSEFSMRIIQLCVRVDDRELTDIEIFEMEVALFMKLSAAINKQIK